MARKGNKRWLMCVSSGCTYVSLPGGGKLELCFAPDEILTLGPSDVMGGREDTATVERCEDGKHLIIERYDENGKVTFRAVFSREGFRRVWKRVREKAKALREIANLPQAAGV